MENLLVLLCNLFAVCCCSQEYNITFYANKTTWIEAVVYCAKSGGVLYSDEADIRNRTDDELYNYDNVWTGKYQAFNPWTIIWGCYRIQYETNSKYVFDVSYAEQTECQMKCTGSHYFAVKGKICRCLHLTEVDEKRKENIKPCNCSTCVTVLRHRIDNVRAEDQTGCPPENTDCTCMAAACIDNKLMLTPELCNQYYGVVCDDNKNTSKRNQQDANDFCYSGGSVLRRYVTKKDICVHGLAQHWTSGKRHVYQYTVQHKDNESKLKPIKCHSVKEENNQWQDFVDCNNRFPFFCKIGDNIYANDILPNGDSQSDIIAGKIGGIISAILIIAVIGAIIVFLYRRKNTSKSPQMRNISSQNNPTKIIYNITEQTADRQFHEIDIKTVHYSLAIPLSSYQKTTTQTERDTDEYTRIGSTAFEIQHDDNETNNAISNSGYNDMNSKDRINQDKYVHKKHKNIKVDKMATSDYALAKPITDTEERDPYSPNTDYDHLNNMFVKNREMNDGKIYDHLKNATESDPTYDHSGVTVREETENYELFNIEK